MTLAETRQTNKVDLAQDALLRCREAAELIELGEYEEARDALGDLWKGLGKEPNLQGLAESARAEALLQVGVLSSRLASARTTGSQEDAKNLLTKALSAFQALENQLKVAEVKSELGICYWRTGAYDEARVLFDEALDGLDDPELSVRILIPFTDVEIWQGHHLEAWDLLKKAQTFYDNCNEVVKGRWHGQLAIVLLKLATTEEKNNYADRAIMEFTAAIYHYEQAGHERYLARNLNNLAMLFHKLGRYPEAHENLDRAREIFSKRNDPGSVAQVDETRCQVLLAEQRYEEAEPIINRAVNTLERGDEQALLADALTTQATLQARLDKKDSSLATFQRAMNLAEEAGAGASAGVAALSLIEELHTSLSEPELSDLYTHADDLLSRTQDAEHIKRLRNCARLIVGDLKLPPGRSLPDVVLAYETRCIEQALLEEHGKVTNTARRLGISHQAFTSILNTRQKGLLSKRTPIQKRRKSIIKKSAFPKKRRRHFKRDKPE
jgi:tetratricopeptide (TPR) repeat protein